MSNVGTSKSSFSEVGERKEKLVQKEKKKKKKQKKKKSTLSLKS